MAYCTNCGSQVEPSDIYCARCGAKQGVPAGPKAISSMTPRTASMLCYIPWFGAFAAIFILAAQRFRQDYVVRFHAFQGLYLFVAYLLAEWVLKPITEPLPGPHHFIGVSIWLFFLAVWIFMLFKVANNEMFKLPVLGELADKSLAEQR